MPLSNDALSLLTQNPTLRWNVAQPLGLPIVLTYSFQDVAATYDTVTPHDTFRRFSEEHKWSVRSALDAWEVVSGITFLELQQGGQTRFSMVDESAALIFDGGQTLGFAYLPNYYSLTDGSEGTFYDTLAGDVFINASVFGDDPSSVARNTLGFSVILHEIGHALGLEHPFEGDAVIDPARDNTDVTIMSYTDGRDPSSLGTADIEAIQYLYGTRGFDISFNETLMIVKHIGTGASEYMHGTELSDIMFGMGGADSLFGADGDDMIIAAHRLDTDGGNGRDTIITQYGDNIFSDTGGVYGANVGSNIDLSIDDLYIGGFGDDTARGGNGNDVLIADRASQFISGEDRLEGGFGTDFLQGGGKCRCVCLQCQFSQHQRWRASWSGRHWRCKREYAV